MPRENLRTRTSVVNPNPDKPEIPPCSECGHNPPADPRTGVCPIVDGVKNQPNVCPRYFTLKK